MADSEKAEDSLLSQQKKCKKPSTQCLVMGKNLMENVPLGA